MRSLLRFALFSLVLMSFSSAPVVLADVPGEGFDPYDLCGYVMGGNSQVGADIMVNSAQACLDNDDDLDGYAEFVDVEGTQVSYLSVRYVGYMDMAPQLSEGKTPVQLNLETGYFEGYGYIQALADAGKNPYVWFDWTCPTCTEAHYTHPTTGRPHLVDSSAYPTWLVGGVAWAPGLIDEGEPASAGWLNLNGLRIEVGPYQLEPTITIETLDGVDALDVTLETAPLADGYEYYIITMALKNVQKGTYLTEEDVSSAYIRPLFTSNTQLFLNQVEGEETYNLYNQLTGFNYNSSECAPSSSTEYFCHTTQTIEGQEALVVKQFLYSPIPTSSMLGIDEEDDDSLDYWTDRDGCISIYDSPATDCAGASISSKLSYFFNRFDDRNYIAFDSLEVHLSLSDSHLYELGDLTYRGEYYELEYDEPLELHYKPRVQLHLVKSKFPLPNGKLEDSIREPTGSKMKLIVEGAIEGLSEEYVAAIESEEAGGVAPVDVDIYYQVDSEYDAGPTNRDFYLLLNGAEQQIDSLSSDATEISEYEQEYNMDYQQYKCGVAFCLASNPPHDPTAEIWACDSISENNYIDTDISEPVCYYIGYLPQLDYHAAVKDMLVIGAVNQSINNPDILETQESVSVQGNAELRNLIWEQVSRLTLGVAPSGDVILDDNLEVGTGDASVLMGGRLIFVRGDLLISGSSDFDQKTVVVLGGDVTITGNIKDEDHHHLGLVVLEQDGDGGNIYLASSVSDIVEVNAYLDGGLFPTSDSSTLNIGGIPVWTYKDVREEELQNVQLYWKGTLVSDNTIGGFDTTGPWTLGDGSSTSDANVAMAYDLNVHRTFAGCYPADSEGMPDSSADETEWEVCLGAELSSYNDEADEIEWAPVIFEGSPAPLTLPVLNVLRLNVQTL